MIVLQWATFAFSSPSFSSSSFWCPVCSYLSSTSFPSSFSSAESSWVSDWYAFCCSFSLNLSKHCLYLERLWLSPVCMCNFHPSVHILYLLLLALLPIFLLLRLAPSIEHCQTYSRVNKVSLDREKGNRRGVTPQPSLQQMEPISQIRDRPSIHTNQAWCVCVCL